MYACVYMSVYTTREHFYIIVDRYMIPIHPEG
jgi:hypothetical protein